MNIVTHFEDRFGELGTTARAKQMKAYMKSALRFHGVDSATLRAECAAFVKAHPPTRAELIAHVDALFATDGFDLRSAATVLIERKWKLLGAADLPWLVELARTASCWAHVDHLVMKAIDPILVRDGGLVTWSTTWATDTCFWVRRIALLAHRGTLADDGDFTAFAKIAIPMLPETEFFIRKAIGWVLREVSKRRPALVRDFLVAHAPACSGVTWREATKYLPAAMQREAEKQREG